MFYEYEEFLFRCISRLEWGASIAKKYCTETDTERAVRLAVRFIETRITLKYGILGSSHYQDANDTKSVHRFPTIYETCLLMPILQEEGFEPELIDSLGQVLLSSKRESGFWNFFQNMPDPITNVFPDDLDCTSLCLYALLENKMATVEECRKTVENMMALLETSGCGPNGEWGRWLQSPGNRVPAAKLPSFLEEALKTVRLDASSMLNFLWLLSRLKMEHANGVQGALKFLAGFLNKHAENPEELQPEMYFICNNFLVYYLFSRYIVQSAQGKKILGKKLAQILPKALEILLDQTKPKALNIACITLAILKIELHKGGQEEWKVGEETAGRLWEQVGMLIKKLLELQNKDGSFPELAVYRWSNHDNAAYGGSQVIATTLALSAINAYTREKAFMNKS